VVVAAGQPVLVLQIAEVGVATPRATLPSGIDIPAVLRAVTHGLLVLRFTVPIAAFLVALVVAGTVVGLPVRAVATVMAANRLVAALQSGTRLAAVLGAVALALTVGGLALVVAANVGANAVPHTLEAGAASSTELATCRLLPALSACTRVAAVFGAVAFGLPFLALPVAAHRDARSAVAGQELVASPAIHTANRIYAAFHVYTRVAAVDGTGANRLALVTDAVATQQQASAGIAVLVSLTRAASKPAHRVHVALQPFARIAAVLRAGAHGFALVLFAAELAAFRRAIAARLARIRAAISGQDARFTAPASPSRIVTLAVRA